MLWLMLMLLDDSDANQLSQAIRYLEVEIINDGEEWQRTWSTTMTWHKDRGHAARP
jgi:hypothetical protein